MTPHSRTDNDTWYRPNVALIMVSLYIFFISNGQAQDPRAITAHPITQKDPIHLDGLLNETVWSQASPASNFLQQEPVEGQPATEKTHVFILSDGNNLYIGAKLLDSEPDKILSYQKQRDADLVTDDRFRWIIDPFRDGRTGYFFEINPAGLMSDGLLSAGVGFEPNKSWDGIWETRVTRNPEGWFAEIRIPFRTLNFDPSRDTWGINFQRTIRRKNEEVLWSGHRRNQGLYQTVHAGTLHGMTNLSQGIGLEIIPYVSAAWHHMSEEAKSHTYPTDLGFDLQYSLTPNLRAGLTVNTDFAEVEVDQRRVNLTRFPLYFPEKRDFFLEGSSAYDFAVRNGAYPFFSRRIGLDEEGVPVPITYGLRLGGQAGRYELGFLQIRTGQHGNLPKEDFTIARIKRSLFQQSSLGVIYTRRAAAGGNDTSTPTDRHTVGMDMDLKTSHLLGDKNFQFEAFFVYHTDPNLGGFGSFHQFSSRGIRINYPNDIWRIHTSYREFGINYNPAVGFIDRVGIRRLNPGMWYCPRPSRIPFIRQFEFGFNHLAMWDITHRHLETQWTSFTVMRINFESGDVIGIEACPRYEYLDESFTIHEDITVPIGDYRTWTWTINGNTAVHRRIASGWRLSRGSFWSGHRTTYAGDLNVKPASGVSFTFAFEKNDIDLVEGDFSTHLVRFLGEWHFNPWISVIANFQYDDVSDVVGLFTRFRWILTPGSDLYLVYTHNWGEDPTGLRRYQFHTLSRAATMKVNYTYRF